MERRLAAATHNHGARTAEVLTFSRLADRVFSEVGGLAQQMLTPAGQLLTLQEAARRVQGGLSAWKGLADKPELLQEALGFEPDFVKPNIFEMAEAVGDKPSADPEVVVHSARKMLDMGAKAVCVSMGQEGALLTAKDEPESLYVTTTPKIYDEGAVGTGDAMVGAIANAMHAGMKFDEVARYAVAMGRACTRLAGTEMASLKKVYEVYETTQVYVL